jgi:hypothetical protein
LRRHPGSSFFHDKELRVVVCDAPNIDAAIARALALAVEGELVQIAIEESENRNAA